MSLIIKYESSKKFSIETRGHKIIADQPLSSDGSDKGMMPTELFVGSLAGCIGVTLISFFKKHNIPLENFEIKADFLIAENPHRVGKIAIELDFADKQTLDENLKKAILRVANGCTVHNSMTVPPQIDVKIN